MKIKDLPKNCNLQNIQIILPKHIYNSSSFPLYNIKSRKVYLMGWNIGDFFVKVNLKSKQIYPMFWFSIPEDITEWEVVENKKQKKMNKENNKNFHFFI